MFPTLRKNFFWRGEERRREEKRGGEERERDKGGQDKTGPQNFGCSLGNLWVFSHTPSLFVNSNLIGYRNKTLGSITSFQKSLSFHFRLGAQLWKTLNIKTHIRVIAELGEIETAYFLYIMHAIICISMMP